MFYNNIKKATFLERPNRFIAYVDLEGTIEKCHVKNTGRCRELLQPGVTVYIEESTNPDRKTRFSLIGVEKGELLINMDSQAPNKVVYEWLNKKTLFPDATLIRQEVTYGHSRFDIYVETPDKKIFIEVKGVTLEEHGIVKFPDAPSERAVKHIYELCQAVKEGYEAYVLFVVQMKGAEYFTPNMDTHKGFGEALIQAEKQGVKILAYDCKVEKDFLEIHEPVEVRLEESPIPGLLLKWYDSNARILPWREEPTPYRVWISEIMLQQTRVEAVKPYFERFMEQLPTVSLLASAEEDKLLKLWEGLGYYNRVRNLQKAGRIIEENYGGQLPDEYEELRKLPGIGSYTAGAIASIAYKKPVPAVDGNVLRVMSRVLAMKEDILKESTKSYMEGYLSRIMPKKRAGDFNQALMELGATVCVPNGVAKCEICPLEKLCKARELGIVMELPVKTPKKTRKVEKKTVFLIKSGEKAAIRKRKKTGLLPGLYEFPNSEGHLSPEEALEFVKEQSLSPLRIKRLEESKHIFTHKEWNMIGYLILVEEKDGEKEESGNDYIFATPEEAKINYSIPTAFQAYTKYFFHFSRL